jgi:hypothetical protein
MSSKEFWSLSWYDWTLWVFRIDHIRNQKKQEHEYHAELSRRIMKVIAQGAGMKHQSGRDLILTDFLHLSYDTVENPPQTLTSEEVMKKVKERFKKYLKNG